MQSAVPARTPTRCALALPFAQEFKRWGGDGTLELSHLGLSICVHVQCRTMCSRRGAVWLRERTTTVTPRLRLSLSQNNSLKLLFRAPLLRTRFLPSTLTPPGNGGESEIPCARYECHTRLHSGSCDPCCLTAAFEYFQQNMVELDTKSSTSLCVGAHCAAPHRPATAVIRCI